MLPTLSGGGIDVTVQFDPQTIEQFRKLPPREALRRAKSAIYGAGAVGSEDFLDAYEQLVREGVVTWEQIEEYEG